MNFQHFQWEDDPEKLGFPLDPPLGYRVGLTATLRAVAVEHHVDGGIAITWEIGNAKISLAAQNEVSA